MKKIIALVALFAITVLMIPQKSWAAGGIYASGGGTKTVGETFTVTVSASGATFDTFDGKISVSGPVSIVSFSGGGSVPVWLPSSGPSNGGSFTGSMLKQVNSVTVATIKLKGTGVGSGAVSVSGVKLLSSGGNVGSGAGGASFTIEKAPDLPGAPKVSSSSHPDQNASYEATTIALAWTKDAGVDGFSYLLDQAAGTTPAAKITDANTSASYPDKAIGTYYFHIRAHKADGWGGTTHFKINIKEPDAKIDATLSKPSDIKIEKSSSFVNGITDGTVTGIVIKGKTEPGFTANVTLTPTPVLPEGKTMSVVSDTSGNFELILDFPISAGYHKLSVQGSKEKILTPISDEITFEISQAKGGIINILTSTDANPPAQVKAEAAKQAFKINQNVIFYGALLLILIVALTVSVVLYLRHKKTKRYLRSIGK